MLDAGFWMLDNYKGLLKMIHFRVVIVCLLILVLPAITQAFDTERFDVAEIKTELMISQTGREKALKERGITVTGVKDDLIRRTVRAYGGDYTRNEDTATLTLQGKTYKSFTAQIVDGKYLLIKTLDNTIYLELVDE